MVCMDTDRREIRNASVLIKGNQIVAVGETGTIPDRADEVIDLKGHIVIPGLINMHHPMYQRLTRAIPAVQHGELFNWLTHRYPLWQNLTSEMSRTSTQISIAELMLSGCTTIRDPLYVYPDGLMTVLKRRKRWGCVFMPAAAV